MLIPKTVHKNKPCLKVDLAFRKLLEESASVSAITAFSSNAVTYIVPIGKTLYVMAFYGGEIEADNKAVPLPVGANPLICIPF